MKSNDCKLVRRVIDESEFGQELRSDVMQHIETCSSCHQFFESGNRVRRIVASLAPVEAPADFDFRLKARIAQTSGRRLGHWNFSLAIPSAVVAAVAIAVAGIFFLRGPGVETTSKTNVVANTNEPSVGAQAETKMADRATVATSNESLNAKPKAENLEKSRIHPKRNEVVAQRGRVVVEDYSSSGAGIIKKEQAPVGGPPQLVFPMQTLTVSVDDAKGVSRTISFPTVSFGSQRVLAGNGSSFQPPTRTNW